MFRKHIANISLHITNAHSSKSAVFVLVLLESFLDIEIN